jgi:hypothetical protein
MGQDGALRANRATPRHELTSTRRRQVPGQGAWKHASAAENCPRDLTRLTRRLQHAALDTNVAHKHLFEFVEDPFDQVTPSAASSEPASSRERGASWRGSSRWFGGLSGYHRAYGSSR